MADMHSLRAIIVEDDKRLMCRYHFLLCKACSFIVSVASTPRFLAGKTRRLRLAQDKTGKIMF